MYVEVNEISGQLGVIGGKKFCHAEHYTIAFVSRKDSWYTTVMKWLVGVDEAGRGPLAGPVSVGVVKVPVDFDWTLIPGVGDSKQVSPKKRALVFLRAQELRQAGELDYAVSLVSAKEIDTTGIVPSIRKGMEQAFTALQLQPADVTIKLDGSLYAPASFLQQETIIKGDAKEKVIGLASILAKETRDRYMEKIADQYPEYELAAHKGYGTAKHRAAIQAQGPSPEHRLSFLKNILRAS